MLITIGSMGLQTFLPTVLASGFDVSLALATSALTAYLLGGTAGILVGGFLAARTARHDRVAAGGMLAGAVLLCIVAAVGASPPLLLPVFALIGCVLGATGPSRDLIVRGATQKGAAGRVYGFVYSGLDLGGIIGPVALGFLLDHGMAREVFFAVAACSRASASARSFRCGAPPSGPDGAGASGDMKPMDLGIAGPRALVCASSRGLGRACAQALAGGRRVRRRRTGTAAAHGRRDPRRDRRGVTAVVGASRTEAGRRRCSTRAPIPTSSSTTTAGRRPALRGPGSRALARRARGQPAGARADDPRRSSRACARAAFGRIVNVTSAMVKAPHAAMGLPTARAAASPPSARDSRAKSRATTSRSTTCCPSASTPIASASWRSCARRAAASRWSRRRGDGGGRSPPAASARPRNSAPRAPSCAAPTRASSRPEPVGRRGLLPGHVAVFGTPEHDRSLLLDHANGHKITIYLGRNRASAPGAARQHRPRRTVRPGFPRDLADNRIPAIVDHAPADGGGPLSLMESARSSSIWPRSGPVPAHRPAGPMGVPAVAVLADGRAGTHGRAEPPLQWQRAREDSLCDRPLCARDRPALCCAEQEARRSRVRRRRLLDRGHCLLSVDTAGAAAAGHRRLSHLARWKAAIAARPAVQRAYAFARTINVGPAGADAKARAILYGQSKDTVR